MYDEVYFDSDSDEEDTPSKHECLSPVTQTCHHHESLSRPFCLYDVSLFPLQAAPLAGGRDSGPYRPMTSCCTTPTRTTGTRPGWTPGGDGETLFFFHTRWTQSNLFLPVVTQPLAFLQVHLQKTSVHIVTAAASSRSGFTQQRRHPQLSRLHDDTLPGLSEVRIHQYQSGFVIV